VATRTRRLVIGIGNHVVSVDPATGEEHWRTKLRSGSWTTIREDGDRIYAGAGGRLFALDTATGTILWENPLKGLGHGVVAFGSDSETVAAAAAAAAARAAAAAT
jgi:outer membrane protein assembly factor BamB